MRWSRAAAAAGLTGALGLAAALTLGPLATVTTNGISMEPRITAGDLIVVAPAASYAVGDSVAYRSAQLKTVVLHRIVAVEGDRFVLQGDNNSWLDPERPTVADVVGKELLHLPRGGIWLQRLSNPALLAGAAFLFAIGGTAAATTKRARRQERRTVSPRHRASRTTTPGGLPPALVPYAAAAAAVGVVGVALAGLSWTRPTTTTASAAASTSSTVEVGYTATVRPSAAYDGTTVVAPQPVFRSLAERVDLTYSYAGRPGRIAVDLEVSSGSGWRSTVPLVAMQPLTQQQSGQVPLDLPDLEARASAAAEAIGVPADGLTLTVLPKVWMDGGGQFAPRLPLTLDALALRAASAEVLTASTSTAATTGTTTVPAQLGALGRSVDVATVRSLSVAALALSALAVLVLLGLRRTIAPATEDELIRQRHKELLLPVLPMVLAPGRPVVDVADVEHLVRLAVRYGLLVLHWERSGVTTYVVQDEGTTYRYRGWSPARAAQTAAPVQETASR